MNLMEIKQLSKDVYLFNDKKLEYYNDNSGGKISEARNQKINIKKS